MKKETNEQTTKTSTSLRLTGSTSSRNRTSTYGKRVCKKVERLSSSQGKITKDHSVMENFFGILKSEFLYMKEFGSIEDVKLELEKYITYYNTKTQADKIQKESDTVPNSFYQSLLSEITVSNF